MQAEIRGLGRGRRRQTGEHGRCTGGCDMNAGSGALALSQRCPEGLCLTMVSCILLYEQASDERNTRLNPHPMTHLCLCAHISVWYQREGSSSQGNLVASTRFPHDRDLPPRFTCQNASREADQICPAPPLAYRNVNVNGDVSISPSSISPTLDLHRNGHVHSNVTREAGASCVHLGSGSGRGGGSGSGGAAVLTQIFLLVGSTLRRR
ncbi:hypothetical protein OH77DRAFT_953721 [Trametes cingulata]|nr:hypothetical protein OH77DRAFT_953721 [Trametes cingulata]